MIKKYPLTALFLLTTLVAAQPALSAEDLSHEDQLLSMYFSEDELVETATHSPKPISQVAENVTIITAEEIERMNAHNIDDVISRVTGIFLHYEGKDFNSNTTMHIHGSNYEHVTLLVDGVRVNKIWAEISYANIVPIRIVKRIEIIKGAASSTWGAALGGIINVITKDTGKEEQPGGSLRGSYGEFDSHDFSADIAGKIEGLGYYLSVSDQHSDGLKYNRNFDNSSFFAKLEHELPADNLLSFTFSYSKPDYKASYRPLPDFNDRQEDVVDKNIYFTTNLDSQLGDILSTHLSLYHFENDWTYDRSFITTGTSYANDTGEQVTNGFNGYLNWKSGKHNVVAGLDYQRHELTLKDLITGYEAKTLYEEEWGFYINETLSLGKFTVTPGLRYDAISISDDMFNPSLGITYQLTDSTLLRAIASRGFRKVPIAYKQGDVYFLWAVNDNLEPEITWSYQVGIESIISRYFRYKSTLFYHDAKDVWYSYPVLNGEDETREGVEFELSTIPVLDTWVTANFIYTRHEDQMDDTNYSRVANVIITYDNPEIFTLELAGRYVKYGDLVSPDNYNAEDNNFTWDLSLNKKIYADERISSEFFAVVHNIFDEDQMYRDFHANAPRWIEAGVKLFF